MKMKNSIVIAALICVATLFTGCFGGKMATTGRGGELTGTGGARGFLRARRETFDRLLLYGLECQGNPSFQRPFENRLESLSRKRQLGREG